jgi:hypothetical protein
MLTLPLEKLAYIIEKAREFDAEVPAEPNDEGSNAADDDEREILLDTPDNPTVTELRDVIETLNTDEQEELLALLWVGRGDFSRAEWPDAIRAARQARDTSEADYLIGTPLLADYLEEAAATFELSLEEYGLNRL